MNCDRFIFLITVSVLSNSIANSIPVDAKASKVNLVIEQTTAFVDSIQLAESSIPIPQNEEWSNNNLANEEDNNSKNFPAEKPLIISKRSGFVGIAIASFISLILLKFLFIPPVNISPTAISSGVKNKGSKTTENDRDREAYPTGNRTIIDASQSSVRSSARERYVAPKNPLAENFQTISQLTVLNSNTTKIDKQPSARLTPLTSDFDVVELIKYLQQPDEDLRRQAIWELAQIGDSRGIEPLIKILSQVNSIDRSLVIEAITQIARRSFQPIEELLFFTFDDANPETKQSAIRDLAVVYAFVAPITKQLARMQVDRDLQVRRTAKLAIEQLNLCYFPCLFDDCPGSAKYDSNSNGDKSVRECQIQKEK